MPLLQLLNLYSLSPTVCTNMCLFQGTHIIGAVSAHKRSITKAPQLRDNKLLAISEQSGTSIEVFTF